MGCNRMLYYANFIKLNIYIKLNYIIIPFHLYLTILIHTYYYFPFIKYFRHLINISLTNYQQFYDRLN